MRSNTGNIQLGQYHSRGANAALLRGCARGGYVGHGGDCHPEDILWWSKGASSLESPADRVSCEVMEAGPAIDYQTYWDWQAGDDNYRLASTSAGTVRSSAGIDPSADRQYAMRSSTPGR